MLSHLFEPSSAKMSETSTYHILLVAVITPDLRATPKPTPTPSATPEVTKKSWQTTHMTHASSPSYSSQSLESKADLAACTRLKGKIFKEAMHSHHRYVGNHLITWLHNRFYKVGVSDSQCGFRAFTRQTLEKLKPEASGIEFAINMLAKAPHTGLRIAESTITDYPQVDGAPSKLKSLRYSWFRVKHILTYTPKHLNLDPGLALIALSIALMAIVQMGYSPGFHTSIKGGRCRNDCNNIHKKITLILRLC